MVNNADCWNQGFPTCTDAAVQRFSADNFETSLKEFHNHPIGMLEVKTGLVFILITLAAFKAHPLDSCGELADFISHTNRQDNPLLISLIQTNTLDTSLCVLKALANRTDFYVEDILLSLLISSHPDSGYKQEYLLRVILTAVFPSTLSQNQMQQRTLLNNRAIQNLINQLTIFTDPMLRRQILNLVPFVQTPTAITALVNEGNLIISNLHSQQGNVSAPMRSEILSFFDAALLLKNSLRELLCCELLQEQIVSISEFAGDREVVDSARRVVKNLKEQF